MIDIKGLNQVLNEINVPRLQAAALGSSPCNQWKTLRPAVLKLIDILNSVGMFLPKAKIAAEALQALTSLLDSLCSGVIVSAAADPLSAKLAFALNPGVTAPTESPCAVWARLRPVVVECITELQELSGLVPVLVQIVSALTMLQNLVDALCGAGSGPNAPDVKGIFKLNLPTQLTHDSSQGISRHPRPSRHYIKYPSPGGLRPHIGGPFKVAELCQAYNFPKGLDGGATIGILELGGGYRQTDLDLFARGNGLPPFTVNDMSVNGGTNSPGSEADGEVLLDIQVAVAAYYYCTGTLPQVNVYFAPNNDASFVAVIAQAVANQCDVLSISWGKDEDGWDATTAVQVEQAAIAATQAGCIIFASSGDNSSGDGTPSANVDLPSGCPHIVGCGGTTKLPGSEVVWGDGTPNGRGTGGGYSKLFAPMPTWQVDAPQPPNSRLVPDVAAAADPNTGYLIIVNGAETVIGGTSAVSPLYSGLFASFGKKLGFVLPTLWANPAAFVDIVNGSNGSYQALPGPDACTGLGVPNGDALKALFI